VAWVGRKCSEGIGGACLAPVGRLRGGANLYAGIGDLYAGIGATCAQGSGDLSIVKRLVELHGGAVAQLGRGGRSWNPD
jgi:hypothetical protein